jgi:uncharacterized cupin superfamily protein
MTTLIKFADQSPEAISQDTSGATISGTPEHTVWVHFKGADDSFRAGVWESTAGVFHGPQNDQIEYCYILEGDAKESRRKSASTIQQAMWIKRPNTVQVALSQAA